MEVVKGLPFLGKDVHDTDEDDHAIDVAEAGLKLGVVLDQVGVVIESRKLVGKIRLEVPEGTKLGLREQPGDRLHAEGVLELPQLLS